MPGTKGAAPRGLPWGPRRLCLAGSQGTKEAVPGGLPGDQGGGARRAPAGRVYISDRSAISLRHRPW